MDHTVGTLLPLADDPGPERADAARNRELLLVAASELVRRCGAAAVTTEAVAERAGVGKGTVFRRFGSREGLMAAVLDHTEREWQGRVIGGPPPLGPGAAPMERLLAFGADRVRVNLLHADLLEAAGDAHARSWAAHSFTALHVRHLLVALGVTGDLPYLTAALLAPLDIAVLRHQVHAEGLGLDRVVAGWSDVVRRVVAGG